ncbi:cupin domain-containing protein [Saccharothrix luteola]|uniref:cupin domain-containing protein n=1 Tax=Saccharothrix luteola TaxID=2893018 RepID=UPI001E64CB6A|nr:cupin domain-containing protein [Saccharothrix luteola]MCC8248082.1 cupin domain-containing protein [Saccharothrix luteola]
MFERHGFVFHPHASPSRNGSTQIALWTVEVPADAKSERHQVDKEEVFHVLEGQVTINDVEAGAGDTVVVPPHVEFQLVGGPAKVLVATSVGITGLVGDQRITPPWAL